MIFWTIAYRNVKKNWRHSLSALLSLSASFVSLVLFDGYIADLKYVYRDSYEHRNMYGDLLIEKPMIHKKEGLSEPWKYSIFENEQSEIEIFLKKHSDFVKQRVRFLSFQGMISNGIQSSIVLGVGYDPSEGVAVRGENWAWNTMYGVPLDKSSEDNVVVIGQGLARKLGCDWRVTANFNTFSGGYTAENRPFDCPTTDLQISTMTSDAQLNAIDVKVSGLMDAGYKDIDDRYVMTSLNVAQTLMNTKVISLMSVELKQAEQAPQFIKMFQDEIEARLPEVKIMTWAQHPDGEPYVKTMDFMSIFRNFVVLVILVISTLSVINTLIKIIKERSREVGTLRSIGFKSSQVLKMFMYETFLLAFVGTFLGFIISLVLTTMINFLHIRYKAGMLSEPVLFKISYSSGAYLNAFCILTFVSLLACLVSTRQSLSKKVIENLNHV